MKDEKVQGMEVNAESGEIILRNSHGDYAIVPRKDRKKVQDLMDEGCDSCIDNYVMTLPTHKDYAEEGTLIPEGEPVKGESFTPEGTELKAIVIDNKVYIDDGQGGKVQLGGSQGDKILAEYQVSKNKQQEVLEDVTQDVIDKKVGKQETQGSIAMSDEEVEGSQEDLSATIQTQTANASNNEEPIRGFLRDVLDRKQLKDYDKSVKAGLDPYQTLYELGVDFTVNGKSYGKTETDTPQEEITTTDVAEQNVEANKQEEVLENVTQDVIESKVGKEQEVVEEPAVENKPIEIPDNDFGVDKDNNGLGNLDNLSFDDAFRKARSKLNSDGVFYYNKEFINTKYASEVEEKEASEEKGIGKSDIEILKWHASELDKYDLDKVEDQKTIISEKMSGVGDKGIGIKDTIVAVEKAGTLKKLATTYLEALKENVQKEIRKAQEKTSNSGANKELSEEEKGRYLRWYDNKLNLTNEEIDEVRKTGSAKDLAKLKKVTKEEAKIEYDKINKDIELAILKVEKRVGYTLGEKQRKNIANQINKTPGELNFDVEWFITNANLAEDIVDIQEVEKGIQELEQQLRVAKLQTGKSDAIEKLKGGETKKEYISRVEGEIKDLKLKAEYYRQKNKIRGNQKPINSDDRPITSKRLSEMAQEEMRK